MRSIPLWLILLAQQAAAQHPAALQQMKPHTGASAALLHLLEQADIPHTPSGADTIYLLFMKPMTCPRCEGLINPVSTYLKKAGSHAPVVLLAFYPRQASLLAYLNRRKFATDYVITQHSDSLLRFFEFPGQPLSVPFLVKINRANGACLGSWSLMGMDLSESLVQEILRASQPMQTIDGISRASTPVTEQPDAYMLQPIHQVRLENPPDHPLSQINDACFQPGGHLLAITDDLTLAVQVYDSQTGHFVQNLQPTREEEMMYTDTTVPEGYLRYMRENNILNSMYFNSSFRNDSLLIISASLPEITFDKEHGEIGYNNHIALVNRHLYVHENPSALDLASLPDSLLYVRHTRARIDIHTGYIFAPVVKGWPVEGSTQLGSQTPDGKNPLKESFYSKTPLLAVFDSTGRFVHYLHSLSTTWKHLQTGYLYADAMVRPTPQGYWVADARLGKMYLYPHPDTPSPTDSLVVFQPTLAERNLQNFASPLDYILSFEDDLDRKIIDYTTIGTDVHVLVQHAGRKMEWITFHKDSTRSAGQLLPDHWKGAERAFAAFMSGRERPVIRCLYQSDTETWVVDF